MKVPRMPYCSGPRPNSCCAISAEVSWKFIPKVPTQKTTMSTSRMSLRLVT
jgi:hypothetical protein